MLKHGMASSTTYYGKELIIQSSSEELAEQMNSSVTQGHYPVLETEALLDQQGMEQFGLSIGDTIEIVYSDGRVRQYQISGTYGDFSSLQGTDAHGLQLAEGGLRFLSETEYQEYDYIQLKKDTDINHAM